MGNAGMILRRRPPADQAQLQELEVFQHNYHNLVSILPEEIGPLFVAKQIISVNSFNAIRGGTKKDVIMALLEHVSSPLIAGDVNPFNEMLSIMTNYVTEPVKNLAYRMATELGQSSSSNDRSGQQDTKSELDGLVMHRVASRHSLISSADIVMTAATAQAELASNLKESLKQKFSIYCNTIINTNPMKRVAQEIVTCKVFVFIAGAESVASSQTSEEVALAYITNTPILVVAIDEPATLLARMSFGMRLILSTLKWHKFLSASDNSALSVFMTAVQNCIQSKASDSTQSAPLPAKKRLYNHPTEKAVKLEMIDEEGNFWDLKFGNVSEVSWDQFQAAFQTEFGAKLCEMYKSDENWLSSQLKSMLEATDKVNKAKFLEVMGESEQKDNFWKVVRDISMENYCMKEVLNMKSTVRLTAVENLGKFQTTAVIDALVSLLHDTDPNIRAIAAISLGQTGTEQTHVVDRLMDLLDDNDRICRQSACLSLGRMKAEKAVHKISYLWRNDYISVVRDAAKTALKQIGGANAAEVLWVTEKLQKEIDELESKTQ